MLKTPDLLPESTESACTELISMKKREANVSLLQAVIKERKDIDQLFLAAKRGVYGTFLQKQKWDKVNKKYYGDGLYHGTIDDKSFLIKIYNNIILSFTCNNEKPFRKLNHEIKNLLNELKMDKYDVPLYVDDAFIWLDLNSGIISRDQKGRCVPVFINKVPKPEFNYEQFEMDLNFNKMPRIIQRMSEEDEIDALINVSGVLDDDEKERIYKRKRFLENNKRDRRLYNKNSDTYDEDNNNNVNSKTKRTYNDQSNKREKLRSSQDFRNEKVYKEDVLIEKQDIDEEKGVLSAPELERYVTVISLENNLSSFDENKIFRMPFNAKFIEDWFNFERTDLRIAYIEMLNCNQRLNQNKEEEVRESMTRLKNWMKNSIADRMSFLYPNVMTELTNKLEVPEEIERQIAEETVDRLEEDLYYEITDIIDETDKGSLIEGFDFLTEIDLIDTDLWGIFTAYNPPNLRISFKITTIHPFWDNVIEKENKNHFIEKLIGSKYKTRVDNVVQEALGWIFDNDKKPLQSDEYQDFPKFESENDIKISKKFEHEFEIHNRKDYSGMKTQEEMMIAMEKQDDERFGFLKKEGLSVFGNEEEPELKKKEDFLKDKKKEELSKMDKLDKTKSKIKKDKRSKRKYNSNNNNEYDSDNSSNYDEEVDSENGKSDLNSIEDVDKLKTDLKTAYDLMINRSTKQYEGMTLKDAMKIDMKTLINRSKEDDKSRKELSQEITQKMKSLDSFLNSDSDEDK